MFERFTEKARQVVITAQKEARTLLHSHIGTEHILLGLLVEEGIARSVLNTLSLSADEVRADVLRIVGEGEGLVTGQIPFTPRSKKTLELALREALSLGHNYIGTEHLLLALVREDASVASRILDEHDISAEKVRNQIVRMLSEPTTTAPGFQPRLRDLVSMAKDLAIDEGKWEIAADLRKIERQLQ